jgi:hypothetical protein
MKTTFEDKVAYVATSFYRRFDDNEEGFDATNEYPAVLRTIFNRHDMAGSIALAVFNGDVELKTDTSRGWIEESYDVLVSVFGDPNKIEEEENVQEVVQEPKPKKAAKKAPVKPE